MIWISLYRIQVLHYKNRKTADDLMNLLEIVIWKRTLMKPDWSTYKFFSRFRSADLTRYCQYKSARSLTVSKENNFLRQFSA